MKKLNRLMKVLLGFTMILGMLFIGNTEVVLAADETPVITYKGLTLSGSTKDDDLVNLVNEEINQDFDFTPIKEDMQNGNTYFEYDYDEEQTFASIKLTGWWGKEQGINKFKFQYFDGSSWIDSDTYDVTWTNTDGGPTSQELILSSKVTSSKVRVVILGTNEKWSTKACMYLIKPVKARPDLPKPMISLENLSMQKGTVDLFVDNPSHADIDFGPGGDLSSKDAYIIYDYKHIVEINSVELIGWWPKDQGLRNINFEYFENNEWKVLDSNVEVAWKTASGNGVEETLVVPLSQSVTTTKFRIKVNKGYSSWGSSKINMRLIKPCGELVREVGELPSIIESTELLISRILIGNGFGEFSQSSVDELQGYINEAIIASGDDSLTEEEYNNAVAKLKSDIANFYSKQNALSGETNVTSQGLTLKEGNLHNLVDGQLGTSVAFEECGDNINGSITFELANAIELNELLILSDAPKVHGVTQMELEYFDGTNWIKPEGQPDTIPWKGTIQHIEGYALSINSPVVSTKFRINITKSNSDEEVTRINLVMIKGTALVDDSKLESAISEAKELLKEDLSSVEDLEAILKIHLALAENDDVHARSTQAKVNKLEEDLRITMEQINAEKTPVLDKTKLETAIENAEKLSLDGFTKESIKKLETALVNAKDVVANATTQQQIDDAVTALTTAVNGLEKEKETLDTSQLETMIHFTEEIDRSKYTEDSLHILDEKLANAKTIVTTATTQKEIDQALDELTSAINGLVEITEEGVTYRTLESADKAVIVTGYFHEGVELRVEKYDDIKTLINKITDKDYTKENEGLAGYNIELYLNGEPYVNAKPVYVQLKMENTYAGKELNVICINEVGEIEIFASKTDEAYISFTTTHFSDYAVMTPVIKHPATTTESNGLDAGDKTNIYLYLSLLVIASGSMLAMKRRKR